MLTGLLELTLTDLALRSAQKGASVRPNTARGRVPPGQADFYESRDYSLPTFGKKNAWTSNKLPEPPHRSLRRRLFQSAHSEFRSRGYTAAAIRDLRRRENEGR